MTKKKRQRNERDNAAWQAADIATRKVQKTQLTDDEKKLVFTLSDKDKECVAFFFFCFEWMRSRSFSAFSPTSWQKF